MNWDPYAGETSWGVPPSEEGAVDVGSMALPDLSGGYVPRLGEIPPEHAKVPLRTQARIATFEHRKKIREHGAVIVNVPGGRLLLGRWGWRRV